MRPAGVRASDAAPVDAVLPVLRLVDLGRLELHRAADALAVEVGEQLGLGVSRRPEPGVTRVRPRQRLHPLGRVRERFVGAELDHRPPHVLVFIDDVDVRRAGPIRLARQRANEIGVLDETADEDLLPGLDVGADPHGELRVALEAFVHRRRSYVDRSSRIAACMS